jgi:hypothetical protein
MKEDDDSVRRVLWRFGKRKRDSLNADSALSFRKYIERMALVVTCLLFDGIGIPSMFQLLGLLTLAFAIPLAIVLFAVIIVQIKLILRIK